MADKERRDKPSNLEQFLDAGLEGYTPEAIRRRLDELGIDIVEMAAHIANRDLGALDITEDDGIKITIKDQIAALQLLFKHTAPVAKTVEVVGKGGGAIQHEVNSKNKLVDKFLADMTDSELAALAAKVQAGEGV